jgi:hypothetical protein
MTEFTDEDIWGSSPLNTYGPVAPPSDDEAQAFIIKKARELGKDPQEALRVWANEGKGAWQSNYKKRGVREPSHGPMQLLSGGAGTGYSRGLGNEFQEETGLDPSDPRTWQEGTDYALSHAAQGGWGPWYGAKRAGAGPTWENAPQQTAAMEPMRATEPQPYDAAEEAPPPELSDDDIWGQTQEGPHPPGMEMDFNREPAADAAYPLGNPFTDPNTQYDPVAAVSQLGAGAFKALGMSDTQAAKGGRFLHAVPNSLGSLGYEFMPLDSIPRPAKPAPVAKAAKAEPITAADLKTQLKDESQAAYAESKAAGVLVKPESFREMVIGASRKLDAEKINKKLHGDTHAGMKQLIENIDWGKPAGPMEKITGVTAKPATRTYDIEELDKFRQVAGIARRGYTAEKADDRRLAELLTDHMDDWMENLSAKDVAAGDAKTAVAARLKARTSWAKMRRAEELEIIHEKALNKLGANYTNAGLQTAYKQLYKELLQSKRIRHFSKDERRAIEMIVRGTTPEKALRFLGKYAPTSPLSFMLGGGLGYSAVGGIPGAVVGAGVALGGAGAKALSTRMTTKNVDTLIDMVRRGQGH